MLGFIAYIYSLVSGEITDSARDSLNQSLTKTVDTVRGSLKKIEDSCAEISGENVLTRFIDETYTSSGLEIIHFNKTVYPFLALRQRLLPDVFSIWAFCGNTSLPNSWRKEAGIAPLSEYKLNLSDRPNTLDYWWAPAHDNILPLQTSQSENQDIYFSFNRIIRSPSSGSLIGVVNYQIAASSLFRAVKAPENNTSGTMYLVSPDGYVLHAGAPEAVGKQLGALHSGAAELFAADTPGSYRHENQAYIISAEYFPQLDCSIVAVRSLAELHLEMNMLSRKMLLVLVLSSFGVVLLISIAAFGITRRIRLLVSAMKKADGGDYTVRVNPGPNDEFGWLIMAYNDMIAKIGELINNVYRAQIMEKDAQMRALEAQVNPHFLYNTLTSIACVAKENNDPDAYRMALSLGKFYRLGLSRRTELITVADELEYLNMYLTIQTIRFKDRVTYLFEIDKQFGACKMIRNLLQPLVENAISHGLSDKKQGGIIKVCMQSDQNNLVFAVRDNGMGMPPAWLEQLNQGLFDSEPTKGYGLKNVNDRLRIYYGANYRLWADSIPGKHTSVFISIPIRW